MVTVMGIKHKKLKEWVAAGVITQDTADAIQTHEDHKKRGSFGRGLINLSIFAILIGILSIIASNWHDIPASVKIGVHVIVNLIAGWVAYKSDKNGKDIWREGATLALFGLTLTLIVLIGQIYQLTGSLSGALTLWLFATLPFMAYMGRTYATAVPWLIAVMTTIVVSAAQYLPNIPEKMQFYISVGLYAYIPLALLGGGRTPFLQKHKSALAHISMLLGLVWLAVGASASIVMWPFIGDAPTNHLPYTRLDMTIIMAVGLAAIVAYAAAKKFYKGDDYARCIALFTVVSFVTMLAPGIIPGSGGSLLAALVFIAYWIFTGWTGQMIGHMRIVSLAITIIAIRIYIIYVELFKSLMDTGMGLIVGGVVMLGMIYAARKLNEYLTKKGGRNVAV